MTKTKSKTWSLWFQVSPSKTVKKFREPQKGEETTGEESAGTCRVYPLFSPLPQGLLLFPLLPLQGVEKRPCKGLQKKKYVFWAVLILMAK